MKAIFLREAPKGSDDLDCSLLILLRAWHSGPFLLFDLAQDLDAACYHRLPA